MVTTESNENTTNGSLRNETPPLTPPEVPSPKTLQQTVLEAAEQRERIKSLTGLNAAASIKRNLENEDKNLQRDAEFNFQQLQGGGETEDTGEENGRDDEEDDMNLSGVLQGASVAGNITITVTDQKDEEELEVGKTPEVNQTNITEAPVAAVVDTGRSLPGKLALALITAGMIGSGGLGAAGATLLNWWMADGPPAVVEPTTDTDTIGVIGKDVD